MVSNRLLKRQSSMVIAYTFTVDDLIDLFHMLVKYAGIMTFLVFSCMHLLFLDFLLSFLSFQKLLNMAAHSC